REVLTAALADAGLRPDDPRIRCVMLPRLGSDVLTDAYLPAVAAVLPAPTVDAGRRTGHLGAGDLLAGIAAIADLDFVEPGDVVFVLGAGGGFTWSCAVLTTSGEED
nr:3-oxoacyl-[acyl-carrier-protein] synthase III C-terminal domain-containing protein [Micromonospora sp. DSM 115978]